MTFSGFSPPKKGLESPLLWRLRLEYISKWKATKLMNPGQPTCPCGPQVAFGFIGTKRAWALNGLFTFWVTRRLTLTVWNTSGLCMGDSYGSRLGFLIWGPLVGPTCGLKRPETQHDGRMDFNVSYIVCHTHVSREDQQPDEPDVITWIQLPRKVKRFIAIRDILKYHLLNLVMLFVVASYRPSSFSLRNIFHRKNANWACSMKQQIYCINCHARILVERKAERARLLILARLVLVI